MRNKVYRYKRFIFKIFTGILFGLVILVFVGYVIDQKQRSDFMEKMNCEIQFHNLEINKSAPVIVRQEIFIDAPIEQVWNRLTSIEKWAEWQSSVSHTQIDSFSEKYVSFKWTANGILFHSTIHTNKKYESFGWIGTTYGAQAIHNWHFTKKGNKTKVSVGESLQGLLVDIFSDYFRYNLRTGMKISLEELKKSCEQ